MDTAKFPVESVSWFEAEAFCKGIKAQLPTAAQWEYACRAGTTSVYHFGNSLNGTEANSKGSDPYPYGTMKGPYLERTTKVGSYRPNTFGLFDMHGNVSEWCRDWYTEKTDDLGDMDPERTTEPADGSRVDRGGSWWASSWNCRSAGRGARPPDYRWIAVGFRVIVLP
jgi:formylglycine-generating enzyme required for sulfatase activity